MSLIKLKCIDQKLTFLATPPIYSGDVNTDYVSFEFCETWQDMVKTAVFFRDEKEPYQVVLVDDQCIIPHEVLTTDGRFYFGVFGVLDDKVLTSEIVYYDIGKGTMTHGAIPEPSEEIWQQILNELTDIRTLSSTIKQEQVDFMNNQNTKFNELENELKQEIDEHETITLVDGETVEAIKVKMIVTDQELVSGLVADEIKVSPNMGIKMEDE